MDNAEIHSIDSLALAAKPKQFTILEHLLSLFCEGDGVIQAHIRGSIADKNIDRISDVDLVLEISDQYFNGTRNYIDELMKTKFTILFNGWRDTIVPDFGGVGFVFLIVWESEVYQVDIYMIPSSKSAEYVGRCSTKLIYSKKPDGLITPKNIIAMTENSCKATSKIEDLLIQSLIIMFLITKRCKRNQIFLNYSETTLLHKSLKDIVRECFDPTYHDYGWYQIEERLKYSNNAPQWLDKLKSMLIKNSIYTPEGLAEPACFIISLIIEQHPKLVENHKNDLEFFFNKTGIYYDFSKLCDI